VRPAPDAIFFLSAGRQYSKAAIPSACDDDGGDPNLVPGGKSFIELNTLPPDNPDCEWCGPADPVSNIRRILLPIPPNESRLQRELRLLKDSVQAWHHEFWAQHNREFVEVSAAFEKRE
jgi:hypothetical protein